MLEAKTNKLLGRLVNLLTHHIIPICEDDEHGRPYVLGSGLLISIDDEYFVITAGHVLDPLRNSRKLYFYFDNKIKCNLGSGTVVTTLAPGGIRKNDKLDLGVVWLPQEVKPPFPAGNKIALPWESLLPGLHPREGRDYCAIGFPASKSKIKRSQHTLLSQPQAHHGPSIAVEQYVQMGINPRIHLALSYKKKVHNESGQRQQSPDPHGMSGSPVWLMSEVDTSDRGERTYVVGILIEHKRDHQALVATDIAVAGRLIEEFLDQNQRVHKA